MRHSHSQTLEARSDRIRWMNLGKRDYSSGAAQRSLSAMLLRRIILAHSVMLVAMMGILSSAAFSQGNDQGTIPDVQDIVEKANCAAYYQGHDGRARVSMTITDKAGKTRTREFIVLRRNVPSTAKRPCADQQFYVYFERPADVNKMAYLVWKHLDRDDDRWLYLPALDLVNRIAATDKRTSFVGSDFFYEDVSGRNIDEDEHELLETTAEHFVLKNTPKNPHSVEFSYYLMRIRRGSFVPDEATFFDRNGENYRVYRALKIETIQDFPTVTEAQMEDLRTGSTTTVRYTDIKYDIGLPEEVFSERYLRRPPRAYLR